jgi:hypothetical protein
MKVNRYIKVCFEKNNSKIKKIRDLFNKNLYEFHKRYTKLHVTIDDKCKQISIKHVGFDKSVKQEYKTFNVKKILKDIDAMPMGHLVQKKSLSLYADYKPKTTIKGLGFKDKMKAEYTISVIKDMDYKYQMSVINTMINRAKFHPHRNQGMMNAIKVFKKYKKKLFDTYKKQK